MSELSRRRFMIAASGAGAALLGGCGPKPRFDTSPRAGSQDPEPWPPEKPHRLPGNPGELELVVRKSPMGDVLRARAGEVPPGMDLTRVAKEMERVMERAQGVGIAGPQVGWGLRVATLKLDYKTDHPRTLFVRNPVIVQRSDETLEGYEGCLSIPGVGGLVRRNRWIAVEYTTDQGQPIRVEAEDHNAVLWQHELDHLDGILYVDKVLGELLPLNEVRRRREKADEAAPHRPPTASGMVNQAPHLATLAL